MNKQVAAEMNLAELTAKIHPPICENGRNSRSWSVSPEGDCPYCHQQSSIAAIGASHVRSVGRAVCAAPKSTQLANYKRD